MCWLQIKGPRPKSEAFSGSNSVDVPSIPNPFAKADEAKDAVSSSSCAITCLAVEQDQVVKPGYRKDVCWQTVLNAIAWLCSRRGSFLCSSLPTAACSQEKLCCAVQAKRTVAKNNPLSYINVLGDLAVQEGRKPGQDDPFGGLTGQVGLQTQGLL